MSREFVISTGSVNAYGTRILTDGIDLTQYEKNPVLLWMHKRCFEPGVLPIGRVENLRREGDRLIGTPVFDTEDEFARKIADKWEKGFLKMCSAGIEIIETSSRAEHMSAGQTRPTIVRCKLEEVSIVDIGANDDALQLTREGKVLRLGKGEDCEALPLMERKEDDKPTNKNMKKETLEILQLSEGATEEQLHEAVSALKAKADKAEQMQLSMVTAAVENAIAEKRITEAQKDHFCKLGNTMGIEVLQATLKCMNPAVKPTDVLNRQNDGSNAEPKTFARLGDIPEADRRRLRDENPAEYVRLFKGEYGFEPDIPRV